MPFHHIVMFACFGNNFIPFNLWIKINDIFTREVCHPYTVDTPFNGGYSRNGIFYKNNPVYTNNKNDLLYLNDNFKWIFQSDTTNKRRNEIMIQSDNNNYQNPYPIFGSDWSYRDINNNVYKDYQNVPFLCSGKSFFFRCPILLTPRWHHAVLITIWRRSAI